MVSEADRLGEAAIRHLLAHLFLREADAPLLAQLARSEVAEVLDLLEPGTAATLRGTTWDAAALDDLAAEYARLFLLPGGVSPFAASWMEGAEGGIRARLREEIGTLYAALQVAPSAHGLGNVPADHIGMLLALQAAAIEREAGGGLARRVGRLLAPWATRFAEGVLAASDHMIYRAAARLLLDRLGQDGERAEGMAMDIDA